MLVLALTGSPATASIDGLAAYQGGVAGDTTVHFDLIVPTVDCTGPNRVIVLGAIEGESDKLTWSTEAQLTADCTAAGPSYHLVAAVLTKAFVVHTKPGRRLRVVLHQGSDGEFVSVTQGAHRHKVADDSIARPDGVDMNVLHDPREGPFSVVRFSHITVNGQPFSSIAPAPISGSDMVLSPLSASGEAFTVRYVS